MTGPVRILVVDDSPTARAALRFALSEDPGIEVVGEAADGATATRLVRELAPDLVTMDVFLRAESGLDVAAAIMSTKATPIVVVTASDPREPGLVFRAMQVGVLDVSAKLPSPTHPDYEARRSRLARTLKTLASVPVIHRFGDSGLRRSGPPVSSRAPAPRPVSDGDSAPRAVARDADSRPSSTPAPARNDGALLLIGASTGGPPVLAALLRALPKPFPSPIAIVQHMTPGFVRGFASWLAVDTGHRVEVVDSSRALESGTVYVASDEHHLVLEGSRRIAPLPAPPRGYHRPSIDVLFESAATPAHAPSTTAVLLTGMGSDGAQGLSALRRAGSFTIAQAPRTCAVKSMPERAIELGAAQEVLEPSAMPATIVARFVRRQPS